MFDHKNSLKACCVFSLFNCLTSSSFLEHETFCADASKPFLKKKGFTRASERLDNCPTRLCTTTVRNRLHYSVGIIRSKAMFANDAQKHFCTASAGNVDVLWVAKYRKMTLNKEKKKKRLLRALTRAASPCNETHADRRLLWHLSNNLLHSEKPSLLQASRVCLKIWFNAPLKHSQTEFISSFFGQSHNNTTIFRVMEARKHLSPFYWNIYSVIDFCYSLFICPNMK